MGVDVFAWAVAASLVAWWLGGFVVLGELLGELRRRIERRLGMAQDEPEERE